MDRPCIHPSECCGSAGIRTGAPLRSHTSANFPDCNTVSISTPTRYAPHPSLRISSVTSSPFRTCHRVPHSSRSLRRVRYSRYMRTVFPHHHNPVLQSVFLPAPSVVDALVFPQPSCYRPNIHAPLEDRPHLRRHLLQRLADPAHPPHHPGHSRPNHPPHHRTVRAAPGLGPHRRRSPRPRPGRLLLPHSSHPRVQSPPRTQPRTPSQHPRPLRRPGPRRLPRPSQRYPQNLRVPHLNLRNLLPNASPLRLGLPPLTRPRHPPKRRRPHPRHPRLHLLRRRRPRPDHPHRAVRRIAFYSLHPTPYTLPHPNHSPLLLAPR